jgi:hypothetical protein
MRLHAIQLVAIPRTLASPEARALVAGLPPGRAMAALERLLHDAASSVAAPG